MTLRRPVLGCRLDPIGWPIGPREIGTVYDIISDTIVGKLPAFDESHIENVGLLGKGEVKVIIDKSIDTISLREEFAKCNLPADLKIKLLGDDFIGQPSFLYGADNNSRSVHCQILYINYGVKQTIKDLEQMVIYYTV